MFENKTACLKKLFALYCFLLLFLIGNGQSKKLSEVISVNFSNISLDQAFDSLSKKCSCNFTYNASDIDGSRLIYYRASRKRLDSVIQQIINDTNICIKVIQNQIVLFKKTTQSDTINYSTERLSYSGIVYDSITRKVLPFATISIKGQALGTIANENGAYAIKLGNNSLADTLIVSYLGYYECEIPLTDSVFYYEIYLKPNVISLQEVLVRSLDPISLVRKARSMIVENNYINPYNFETFYRESVKKDSRIMVYSEAIMSGYKPALRFEGSNTKAEIIRGRKYTDVNKTDTLLVKLKGGGETCFQLDLTNEFPDFLKEKGEEKYDYRIIDITTWKNELVYVISFKKKEYVEDAFFMGEFYITLKENAILGAVFEFTPEYLRNNNSVFVSKKSRNFKIYPKSTQYNVRYFKWNGKYYVRHVRGEMQMKVRKKKSFFRDDYSVVMEMVYTYIDTTAPQKPLRKNVIKTHEVFSESKHIYDATYWERENIILPEANIIEAFKKSGYKLESLKEEKY